MIDAAILRKKPWNEPSAPRNAAIDLPKGMVGSEERACYYWLAHEWHSGAGCIVDAGCFLGASTFAFAAGAADAGRRSFGPNKLIHAFDYFKVVDAYVGEAISRDFRPISAGESYLDIFHAQNAPYEDMIETYPGDFLSKKWNGAPIEILFIDIAKTSTLNAHACGEFLAHLIPGQSVIVQQDYYHCWHPYIHTTMEYLSDEVELCDDHIPHQSAMWRLLKPVPKEKILRLAADDLTRLERMTLLERLIGKASPTIRPMIEVVRIWQMCLDGDKDAARREIERLKAAHELPTMGELWAIQALEIEATL